MQEQCQTLLVIISLFDVFCTKLFLITNMRVATEVFFSYVVLLLLNWLGLVLVLQFWSWPWSQRFGLVFITDFLHYLHYTYLYV